MKPTLPQSVKYIIDKMKQCKHLNNDILSTIVTQASVTEHDLSDFATYSHPLNESYGRKQLYADDHFCIYVMTWLPGDFTAIHNHGHSEWGMVYFFGDAEHRLYQLKGNSIVLAESNTIKSNNIAHVCGNFIHAMGNSNSKPFLTLHIYGSNTYIGSVTEDSILYEIEKQRSRLTLGPAFIDIDDKLCKTSQPLSIEDENTINDYYRLILPYYQRTNNVEMENRINNYLNS